jgi:hypothetical protein
MSFRWIDEDPKQNIENLAKFNQIYWFYLKSTYIKLRDIAFT